MNKKNYKYSILIIVLIIYQSFLYFMSKFTPFKLNIIGSELDNAVPFVPAFIYFYISWYIMLYIVPYIIAKYDKKMFYKYWTTTIIAITVLCFIYLLFPTAVTRPSININSLSSFITNLVYLLDTPGMNCFPSMHCAISFIFIFNVLDSDCVPKKWKITITIWSFLVILSTLFVKQHVIYDVVSSFVIVSAIYKLVLYKKCWNKNMLKYVEDKD